MKDKDKLNERILKAIVNWNKQEMTWDRKFLEYQDAFDLIIHNDGNTITLITKMKHK